MFTKKPSDCFPPGATGFTVGEDARLEAPLPQDTGPLLGLRVPSGALALFFSGFPCKIS